MGYVSAAAFIGSYVIDALFNIWATEETTAASDRALEYTQDFVRGSYNENERYWNDYIRRHHLEKRQIMYPYRTGLNYDLSKVYTSDARLVSNDMARTGSYVYGATGLVRTAARSKINYNKK